MIEVVHLLDDFAFGGVTRALTVFDHPELTTHARSRTHAIGKDLVADRFDADLLVTHVPPCWSRLPFLLSLRMRNRHARLVHVEHSADTHRTKITRLVVADQLPILFGHEHRQL